MVEQELSSGDVVRYHSVPHAPRQTVAEHSWRMLTLLFRLYPGRPTSGLMWAIQFHDAAEIETGDIPSPTKKLLNTDALQKMENAFMLRRGYPTSRALTPMEARWLKALDCLEGYLFCKEHGLTTVRDRYRSFLNLNPNTPDEIQKFLDEEN